MNRLAAWMLLAGTAITSVGCSTGASTHVRGQGPEHACPTGDCQMGHGSHMEAMPYGHMQHGQMQHGPMMQGSMMHDWSGGGYADASGCWHGPMAGAYGPGMMGGGMNGGMAGNPEPMGHTINYTTSMPKNLRYPNPNVPPTVVQYPYYTTKGPSDFFMK